MIKFYSDLQLLTLALELYCQSKAPVISLLASALSAGFPHKLDMSQILADRNFSLLKPLLLLEYSQNFFIEDLIIHRRHSSSTFLCLHYILLGKILNLRFSSSTTEKIQDYVQFLHKKSPLRFLVPEIQYLRQHVSDPSFAKILVVYFSCDFKKRPFDEDLFAENREENIMFLMERILQLHDSLHDEIYYSYLCPLFISSSDPSKLIHLFFYLFSCGKLSLEIIRFLCTHAKTKLSPTALLSWQRLLESMINGSSSTSETICALQQFLSLH